jgi:hypothetical protein
VTEQSRFHCFLTAVHFIPVSVFNFFEMITLGLVTFSWLCFQMNMNNYPHVTIAEDGSLCSTGQHRPGFPRVLYDALRQLGYNGDAPVYRGRMSMAHGQDVRGQRGDTPQLDGAMDGNCHRGRAG